MVGGEDRGQVEPSDALLDHEHQQRTPRANHDDEQRREREGVQAERAHLNPSQLLLRIDEELHAVDMHDPREAEEQRKEQARLMAYQPARETGLRQGLLLRVGDDSDVDVGVEVLVVGIAVMPVVLVHPPSMAHAEQPVPGDDANHRVDAAAREHLLVS